MPNLSKLKFLPVIRQYIAVGSIIHTDRCDIMLYDAMKIIHT